MGQHLFHECIGGYLAGKTRVLVTHQLQYLPHADRIAVLKDGRVQARDARPRTPSLRALGFGWKPCLLRLMISFRVPGSSAQELGTYAELIAKGVDFHQYEGHSSANGGEGDKSKAKEHSNSIARMAKAPSKPKLATAASSSNLAASNGSAGPATGPAKGPAGAPAKNSSERGQLVKKEGRAEGQVKRSVYKAYLSAWGPGFILPVAMLAFAISSRGMQVGQNAWLSVW